MTTKKIEALARRLVMTGRLPKYLDADRCVKTLEDFDVVLDAHGMGFEPYRIASEHGFELDIVEEVIAALA